MLHIKKPLNLEATNERLGKIAIEMGELSKNLEFTQRQHNEELGSIKKDITKLENNIKSIEKDLFLIQMMFLQNYLNLKRGLEETIIN